MKTKLFLSALAICLLAPAAPAASLIESYRAALSHDKQLQISDYERQVAEARSRQTVANLLPSVSLIASKQLDTYKRFDRDMDEGYMSYGVSVRQQIFRPAMWMAAKAESKRKKAAQFGYENARNELALRLSQAFFDYQFAAQMSALAAGQHEADVARVRQIEKSFADGLVNKMDYLEAKIRADRSFLQSSKSRRDEAAAKKALENITGMSASAMAISSLNTQFFEQFSPQGSLEQNASLRQQIALAASSHDDYLSRRSEFFPTVDFSASYTDNIYDDEVVFGDKRKQLVARVSVNMPIFTSGFLRARLAEARFSELAQQAKTEQLKDELQLQFDRSASDYAAALEQTKIAAAVLEHAKLYETAMERSHAMGLKDLVELLDARARAFEARAEAIKSASALVTSFLRLKALGSGISEADIQSLSGIFE